MSIHLRSRGRQIAALCAVVVSLSLAACSGSAATAQNGTGGGGGVSAPAASSDEVGGIPGLGDFSKYCAAMKVADAQALVKPTIAAAQTGGPHPCAFVLPGEPINGDNLTVTVFPNDVDKGFYNDSVSGPATGSPNPLPGVGDVAVWEQPLAGESAPYVVAHQGSLTCVVLPPADTGPLTIEQTGTGPMYQISAAAAAAYAVKEAVLCADMFSVGS